VATVSKNRSSGDPLQALDRLPSLPNTAVRLVEALNGDGMSMAEVEQIVRCDEAVVAAVLRLANSATHAGERTFDLKESITRVGGRRLQQLALSMSAGRLLQDGGKGYGLQRGELWRGSLCGALAAELLAQETGRADSSLCFVAGLMRDVGKIAMDAAFDVGSMLTAFSQGRQYAVERGAGERGESGVEPVALDQLEVERQIFGLDHAGLGAELCTRWNLPDHLVLAVRYHHEPAEVGEERDALIDVVHCGDALTCMLGIGVGFDGLAYRIDEGARHNLGLEGRSIETFLPQIVERFETTVEQIQLD
jgi:HD-like signal output (HDOD) protein